jgi:hypothetical protein
MEEVEEVTREQVLAQGAIGVQEVLARGDSYLLLAVDEGDGSGNGAGNWTVVAACTDQELMGAVIAGVSLLGAAQLGPETRNMPPRVIQSLAITLGIQMLQDQLRGFAQSELANNIIAKE